MSFNSGFDDDIRACRKCGNRRFQYDGTAGKKALKVILRCARCSWKFVKENVRRY